MKYLSIESNKNQNHQYLKKFLKRKNSNSYLNNYLPEIDYHQK